MFCLFADQTSLSISLFDLIIFFICILILALMCVVLKMFVLNRNKTESSKGRKGYLPTATSPGKNVNMNNTRELKPPDLWIHHETVELKSIDKNSRIGSPTINCHDNFAKIKKTNSTYGVNSSLYDDIGKVSTSQMDNMNIATMRRSSTIRPKMNMEHHLSNGVINMEPSTGLSRPMYPKSQFHMQQRSHMDTMEPSNMNLHLYDPVSVPCGGNQQDGIHVGMGGSSTNSYMSGTSSSSPHSVISSNTVLTNSSNCTNSSTSPPNTAIYLSNKRPSGQMLKSFGVPTPPPPLPSLVSLNNLPQNVPHNNIYNCKHCLKLLSLLHSRFIF